VGGETGEELACAPGGYGELGYLLVVNLKGGEGRLFAFSELDGPFIGFVWFIESWRRFTRDR
jgi:hypothetical protein